MSGTSSRIKAILTPTVEASMGVVLVGRELETTQVENKVACRLLCPAGLHSLPPSLPPSLTSWLQRRKWYNCFFARVDSVSDQFWGNDDLHFSVPFSRVKAFCIQ